LLSSGNQGDAANSAFDIPNKRQTSLIILRNRERARSKNSLMFYFCSAFVLLYFIIVVWWCLTRQDSTPGVTKVKHLTSLTNTIIVHFTVCERECRVVIAFYYHVRSALIRLSCHSVVWWCSGHQGRSPGVTRVKQLIQPLAHLEIPINSNLLHHWESAERG
jgi:hypothetical protein